MGNGELLTTQEVAEELSLSDAYIRQLIKGGKAKPVKRIGNSWVFTREEVERLRVRPKSKGGRPKKSV